MKKMILVLIVISSVQTFAQLPTNNLYFDQVKSSLLLDSFRYKKSTNNNEIYLFESWMNDARIVQNNTIYKLSTLNYNIRNDRFEAKFEQDSIFVIDSPKDVVVEIKNRKFKRFNDPETNRLTFFEIVADINGNTLIIRHGLKIEEGPINPLTKEASGPDVLVKKQDYFLMKGIDMDLEKFKLNKKSIYNLIEEKKRDIVQNFAKKNKLKFNRISDLPRIAAYYNSL